MSKKSLIKCACLSLLALAAAGTLVAGGCGKKDEGPKHKVIDGKVTHIDATSDEVRMLWYNPKEKVDQEIKGTLASEAEIFINGRTAKLEDVVIDDQVRVTGRVEKHDGERKLVAVSVHVTRTTTTEPAESGTPAATQPQ